MLKKILATLLTAAMLLSFAACSKTEEEPAAPESAPAEQEAEAEKPAEEKADAENEKKEAYTFTDDLGRTVTVSSIEKVAVLLGSHADVWAQAGGTVFAAVDDAWEDFKLPMPEGGVNLGGTKSLSLELLLGCEPDFILASTNSAQHMEWQSALEGSGIPTAYFDVTTFDDYLRMLNICTDITGRKDLYEEKGLAVQKEIEEIMKANEGKPSQNVLMMRASAASIRAKGSTKNVLGEMLLNFGCKNIADNDKTLLENLSAEAILLQNPDKIFFIQTGDDLEGINKNIETLFKENPLLMELDAVKNKEVYLMDKHLYNLKPNARWAEAYAKLAEILYAEA